LYNTAPETKSIDKLERIEKKWAKNGLWSLTRSLPLTSYLVNQCAVASATDEYTRHSVAASQRNTGAAADILLAPGDIS